MTERSDNGQNGGLWPAFDDCLPHDEVFETFVDVNAKVLVKLGVLYDRNRPDLTAPRATPTIPKVIHQIWLGSPLPRKLARYRETWQRPHPQWEFKLWTDDEVARLDFPSRSLFDAANCWGQKSDLLRMEILNRDGGVYVDLDYECYQPIDELVARYDFFSTLKYLYTAHLGWPAVWQQPIVVCNSLIGARPGHPVLGAYLSRVASIWDDVEQYGFRDDELMAIAVAAMGGKAKATQIKETGVRTFIPFGDVVTELAGEGEDRDIILPPLFFNPVMTGAKTLYLMPDFWQRCRARGVKWPKLGLYGKRHPLSIARHISENSWV
jgi:hypothetical protein